MENKNVVIVDYGMGNLFSVQKKVAKTYPHVLVSNKADDILSAAKIILPGVGHFAKAVENLHQYKVWDALNIAVLEHKIPILGICLGMQLMAKYSEEGNCEGLGWMEGKVIEFEVEDNLRFKIPHTGWNQVKQQKNSKLLDAIPDESLFYFVHSFRYATQDKDEILQTTNYEITFPSAIEKNNIFGVQYHPEKSHDVGLQMIKNFINL
ncbi:MAG: imidazole glycerol phosphate synthase subunit HisH [Bacteroidota bacterium]|jgi:glutamine amidotransferase